MDKVQYIVYVLQFTNGHLYIGHTNNLQRRLHEHAMGLSPYTRKYTIESLVYQESYQTRAEAMQREKYLKSGRGRRYLKDLLSEQSA